MQAGHEILLHKDNRFLLLLFYCVSITMMNHLLKPLFYWKSNDCSI